MKVIEVRIFSTNKKFLCNLIDFLNSFPIETSKKVLVTIGEAEWPNTVQNVESEQSGSSQHPLNSVGGV